MKWYFLILTHAIYAQPKSFQPRSKWLKLQKLRSPPPLPVQMLKPFREPQKQKGKTNQFGCGRPTGAADLKHANQQQQQRRWRAKQLKPENCRPGNKHLGERRGIFSPTGRFFRYWGDHLHRRRHPACDNLH